MKLDMVLRGVPPRDTLTGLSTRAVAFGWARRESGRRGTLAAAFVIDLDRFGELNSELGHAVGDRVLVEIGGRLTEVAGDRGIVARLDGDEFVVLIADLHEPVAARVEAFQAAVREPVIVASGPERTTSIGVSASIGVATTADGADLLRHAELALSEAKRDRRGGWSRYRPALGADAARRHTTRADLNRALRQDQLRLEYQPIVGLEGGSVAGFEALVRWQHPHHGLLGPADFVGAAEENGQIVPLGAWVLRRAVAVAARWRTRYRRALRMSVNVSPGQLRRPQFVDEVFDVLAGAGLPPENLMLEITESLPLADGDRAWHDVDRLRAGGVRIAIDDFGTGYSNLAYLRNAPVDVLKVDRSFTKDLARPQSAALVENMVRLAHSMELTVIAEGIERWEEATHLKALRCRYGQGFFFGRPLPEPAAERLLDSGQPPRGARRTVAT
jgi:diguanylate cyclase (GGDEF)-like protein